MTPKIHCQTDKDSKTCDHVHPRAAITRSGMMIRAGLACFVLAPMGPPVMAAGTLYDCDITKRKPGVEWISPKLAVVIDEAGTVSVLDGVILHFVDKPVVGTARRRGSKLIVDWLLAGVVDGAGQNIPQFSYRATIDTGDNSVSLRGSPVGYAQRFSGRGSCKTRVEK